MKYGRTVAMSNNYWDEDEDEDTDINNEPMDGSDLLKKLRKAKRADEKRIKELTDQLDTFNKSQRESVIKKVLEIKGVSPKAARLIMNEIQDVNEDTVSNWIDDNADMFGLQVAPQESAANTMDRAALRQQDIVTQGAITPDRAEDTLLKLNNAASAEEIIAMIQSGDFN
jgi:hypothetical protein